MGDLSEAALDLNRMVNHGWMVEAGEDAPVQKIQSHIYDYEVGVATAGEVESSTYL